MESLPPLNPLAVILAGTASFAWGGLYFAVLSLRVARIVGLGDEPQRMAPPALVIAYLTRLIQAFGVAAVLAFAGVEGLWAGALGGAAVFALLMLPILVGQAAWGERGSWQRLAVAIPEALLGVAIMGAVGLAWR